MIYVFEKWKMSSGTKRAKSNGLILQASDAIHWHNISIGKPTQKPTDTLRDRFLCISFFFSLWIDVNKTVKAYLYNSFSDALWGKPCIELFFFYLFLYPKYMGFALFWIKDFFVAAT